MQDLLAFNKVGVEASLLQCSCFSLVRSSHFHAALLSPYFHLHSLCDDRSSWAAAASLSECSALGFVLSDICFPTFQYFGLSGSFRDICPGKCGWQVLGSQEPPSLYVYLEIA